MLQRLKKNVPFIVSLVFAVAAAVLIYTSVQASRPTVPVLVATRNLSVGEKIALSDVAVKRLPVEAVPQTALRDPRQAAGQTVTGAPILTGDVVRAEHLSAESSLAATLATYAPPGWVAVELPPETGKNMEGVRRGDTVDVYAETAGGPNGQGTVVGLVARGAVVLATPWTTVGTSVQQSQSTSSKSFVVAVKPEDAPALASLLVRGKKAAVTLVRRQ
ncbi:flagellar basal body P-ring biosynthesis protein FlgA [Moorella thermoacetica]|uniref:Flagellar basal body P-ring biosynthesis protein FlgA n=1 Tax=Neomoorella thermoacetica TaxID=1525 RepID=A0A1J5NLU9_NEOTH|nr:flagellar basal body P-ring biosynthesis protein FlgA [Moorella thermoacetica]